MTHSQNNSNESNITQEFITYLNQKIHESLPKPSYAEVEYTQRWTPLTDGVNLSSTIVLPKGEGPWPVILTRNPYGTDDSVGVFMGRFFAEQGYVYVFNRVRGTGKSEGDFDPFVREREDGREVVDWVSKQPWCDGNIGTFGGSYLGHVQWCIADYQHPALKTMFIQNYGIHPYHLFFRNGMFRQEVWTEWACQMMEDNKSADASYVMEQVQLGYEVFPQIELGKQLKGKDCVWYNQWITNTSENDPYWAEGFWNELQDSLKHINYPLMLQGGWFDVFCLAQLDSWRALSSQTRAKSRFLIGPWQHAGMVAGDLAYPGEAVTGSLQLAAAIEWFDYQLKGKPYPHKLGVIEAYSIGDNRWKLWQDDITFKDKQTFYFDEGGTLSTEPQNGGEVHYEYDPTSPTASISYGLNKGSSYCPEAGSRDGVINFISEPLTEDIYIAGKIQAELYVGSSVPATAFSITIMETFEDGKSVWICEDISDIRWSDEAGLTPYEPDTIIKLNIRMQDITWMLRKGSRLRVDISSSSYPMYHVHPNTTEYWASCTDRVSAHQTIYFGNETPTCLILQTNPGTCK